MNIAIIDADLIGRKRHRFPNLCLMKISGYEKERGNDVILITDYRDLFSEYIELPQDIEPHFSFIMYDDTIKKKFVRYYQEENIIYDKIYISKVFEDTPIPLQIKHLDNVVYGGTGFYYDNALDLPYEIEHHMPDYHLYDEWVNQMMNNGWKRKEFEYYLDYSIGYTTRGCFRQCSFCVNKKYKKVFLHSSIDEFLDESRPYICLLDDNVLGFGLWEKILDSLIATKKPFQFKQGMDLRIMTDKKANKLSKVKYYGDYIFAFDHIKDKELIEEKLELWRKYNKNKSTKLYVLCAYDESETYNEEFWLKDIEDTFKRIFILAKYNCKPYIMRFKKYENSPYRGIYINLASWGNQPHLLKKMSFRQYSIERGMNEKVYKLYKDKYDKYLEDGYKKNACWKYMENFSTEHSEIANTYFDTHYYDILNKSI
ncbi:MAG: hypothetical protein PHT02_00055 [Tissierellia bacterium]|nr:hypothetical protein [Tissierellia bacterium]